MSNFDKWFKDYHSNNEAYAEQLTKDAFEAGAASRQAEVDCLKVELDAANERALMLLDHKNKMVDKLQSEVDALQNRIDELKKMAFNLKTDLIRENHVEYDKGWKDCATSFYHEILKGESE